MKKLTKYYNRIVLHSLPYFLPLVGLAQTPGDNIGTLVGFVANILQGWIIPLFIMLGLIYVILAVIEYIQANEDSQKREEKKQQIFWGVIGLFVIISVWSLVAIVQNTFNIFSGGELQPTMN
jgi:glycerol uptake facilitator-like aquaporin